MQRKMSILLVSIMMMTILFCSSSEVQAAQDGDYTYMVTSNSAKITKYTGDGRFGYDGPKIAITIPSQVGGFSVTSIGDLAFSSCSGLNSITIPKGVTSIGTGAFDGCKRLTTISIPQGVTSIGAGAFYACSSLSSITFNSATTKIASDIDTIPVATKIKGYDPSTAKDYAANHDNTFESIGASRTTTDGSGAPEAFPSWIWGIVGAAVVLIVIKTIKLKKGAEIAKR